MHLRNVNRRRRGPTRRVANQHPSHVVVDRRIRNVFQVLVDLDGRDRVVGPCSLAELACHGA